MKSFKHFPGYNKYKEIVILAHFGQRIMEDKLSVMCLFLFLNFPLSKFTEIKLAECLHKL